MLVFFTVFLCCCWFLHRLTACFTFKQALKSTSARHAPCKPVSVEHVEGMHPQYFGSGGCDVYLLVLWIPSITPLLHDSTFTVEHSRKRTEQWWIWCNTLTAKPQRSLLPQSYNHHYLLSIHHGLSLSFKLRLSPVSVFILSHVRVTDEVITVWICSVLSSVAVVSIIPKHTGAAPSCNCSQMKKIHPKTNKLSISWTHRMDEVLFLWHDDCINYCIIQLRSRWRKWQGPYTN